MTEKLIETITEAIQDKKGRRIMIADLRELDGTICNYFVICEGSSPMQVEAIAGSVGDFARERCGEKPVNVTGLQNAQWVAMDYVDVMVHVFRPDVRAFYDLETLWKDAKWQEIPDID